MLLKECFHLQNDHGKFQLQTFLGHVYHSGIKSVKNLQFREAALFAAIDTKAFPGTAAVDR